MMLQKYEKISALLWNCRAKRVDCVGFSLNGLAEMSSLALL